MTTAAGYRVKGWHVAAGVTAFFTLVIGIDGAFLALAYRTHPGQVAGKPYEAGLAYNARLRRERAQEGLGWRAAAAFDSGAVVVWMRDRDGRPVRGLAVSATLQRPATDAGMMTLRLTETEPGRYVASPAVESGAWDVVIIAEGTKGQTFEASRRLTWP
jgi:nitrogen fixation protein FixH